MVSTARADLEDKDTCLFRYSPLSSACSGGLHHRREDVKMHRGILSVTVPQHALADMQCKISQLQAVSNACISDKDDGASELVKIFRQTRCSKLGRFIRQVSDWWFIQWRVKLFRGNMRMQMGHIPALRIRSGERRERVSGTEWDRRLSVWRCYSEPDPSNTECLLLAEGIRSCCHIVMWRSVAVLLSAPYLCFCYRFCICTLTQTIWTLKLRWCWATFRLPQNWRTLNR